MEMETAQKQSSILLVIVFYTIGDANCCKTYDSTPNFKVSILFSLQQLKYKCALATLQTSCSLAQVQEFSGFCGLTGTVKPEYQKQNLSCSPVATNQPACHLQGSYPDHNGNQRLEC